MDEDDVTMRLDDETNSKFMPDEEDAVAASPGVPVGDDHNMPFGTDQVMVLDESNTLRRINQQEELLKYLETKPEATLQNPKVSKALDHLQNRNVEQIQHFSDLGEYMKQLRDNKEICDIKFRIDNDVFYAHRIALACFSPYLLDFFNKNAAKFRVPMTVRVYGVTSDVFQVFLEFVYNREINVNFDNLVEVTKMACDLGAKDLKEHCFELLKDISLPKAIQILRGKQFARSYQMTRFLISRIAERFPEVYDCEEFYKLDVTAVCRVLSNNDLRISTEMQVFRVALKWIVYSIGERKQYLSEVMSCVRFQHMTQKELFECVEGTDVFKGCPEVKETILRANWVITAGILDMGDPLNLQADHARTWFTGNQYDRRNSCENCSGYE